MSAYPSGGGFGESGEAPSMVPAVLRDPVGVLKRGFRWGCAAFVLTLTLLLVGAHFAPIPYQATTQLLMTAKRIPDEFVPSTIVASVSEQFQAIRGQVFTRSVLAGLIEETGIYAAERELVGTSALVERLRNDVEITSRASLDENNRERSVLYRISLTSEDPVVAARTVNAIAGQLIAESIAYRAEMSTVTSDFMRREFERADAALRAHQREFAAFRAENRGSLPSEQLATTARLERLESQRRTVILQLNDVQLRARLDAGMPETPTEESEELAVLKAELVRKSAIFTDEHPSVVTLRRQIAAIEANPASGPGALDQRGRERAERAREMESLRARLDSINEEVSRLEASVDRAAKIVETYRSLEREEAILQTSYDKYFSKLKEAELSSSMESAQKGTSLTRIEEASVPSSPVFPRVLLYLASVVAAIGAGVLVCFGHELLHAVVIDSDHAASIVDVPVLGSVPRI